jgi:hypothetical protein
VATRAAWSAAAVVWKRRCSGAAPHECAQQHGCITVHTSAEHGLHTHIHTLLCSTAQAAERRRALLKYVHEVQPALIDQFVACGPPAVVAAMRNTITNMLGTLPPQFFTVTISTVGECAAQLHGCCVARPVVARCARLQPQDHLLHVVTPAPLHAPALCCNTPQARTCRS